MIDATAVEHPPASRPHAGLELVLTRCPLCVEDEAEPIAVGRDFDCATTPDSFLAVRCRSCELVYLNPRPAAGEHSRLYPPRSFALSSSNAGPQARWLRAVVRQVVRRSSALPATARFLEVGYGMRLHLGELRDAGGGTGVLEAVTPHEILARSARRDGFIVHQGRVDTLKELEGTYEIVFLLHALEHCEFPLEEVSSVRRLLRGGGRLVILTQNADSAVGRRFQGRHWAGYDFPRHPCLFGPSAVRRLAAAAGLEVERLGTVGDSRMWQRSAANLGADWGAPAWLNSRVERGGFPFGGLASLAESASQLGKKGAWLEVILRKPEESEG
jgi:SAM-dependent methyltransferase